MKTLKKIRIECEQFYTENAAIYFATSFTKKMGGTQTITFENDFIQRIELDKREFYQGRGTKYNNASMHEHIDVYVSLRQFNERVNLRANSIFEAQKENAAKKSNLKLFCKNNILNIKNYDLASGDCIFFNKDKKSEIEKELNVDLSDFINSTGKTYYFTESKIGLLLFYHNHRQSYSFEVTTQEKRAEFYSERESWTSAPYAHLLGQNENINLYVC